jgi:hypothetical protein
MSVTEYGKQTSSSKTYVGIEKIIDRILAPQTTGPCLVIAWTEVWHCYPENMLLCRAALLDYYHKTPGTWNAFDPFVVLIEHFMLFHLGISGVISFTL